MKVQLLKQLESDLEGQGLKPGTPLFERAYRARKVDMCKELQRVASCWECQAFDHCALVKAHLVDLNTPIKKAE